VTSPTIHVVLVDFLQASHFFMGFAFRSFYAQRNVQQYHHGRISSILSVCPIVSCADVDCYVSGTFNDDLCALFGWFGRRQMAKIQIHDFRLVFRVAPRVCCNITLSTRFRTPKMHPILHFILSLCFLHYFWPFVVAWRSFWSARFVRTDRPRSANHSYDAFTDPKMHPILRFIYT
jgi:hypothetical protein